MISINDPGFQVWKKTLLNRLPFNTQNRENSNHKILLVEGSTDALFFSRFLSNDTSCLSVKGRVESRDVFSKANQPRVNCKEALVTFLFWIRKSPDFIEYPHESISWPIYGVVDRDMDNGIHSSDRLFVTDTHDLETLILSTDECVLQNLKHVFMPEDILCKAAYLADQLASCRLAIRNLPKNPIDAKYLNEADGIVLFDKFVTDDFIDIDKLVRYLDEKARSRLSSVKINKIKIDIYKSLKKQINQSKQWKIGLENFALSENLWLRINGHDVLSAIRYLWPEVNYYYKDTLFPDRSLEHGLIDAYNIKKVSSTELYVSLKNCKLLNPSIFS